MPTYYPRASVAFLAILEGETEVRRFACIPRSVEVERNDHRHADTANLEVDYRDLPLDPRTVRSLAVQVYLGDVASMDGELSTSDAHRRFLGYVDEPEATLEEAGEVVRLQCRDYTALFLDFRWPETKIRVDRAFTDVIAEVLATVPGAGEMKVAFDADGAGALQLSAMIGRSAFAPQDKDDAWTVLVDLCGRAGLIPVVVLDTLRIVSASDAGTGSVRFLYGQNVATLRYRRKYNETATQQIEVRCWDEQARATRIAQYPAAAITTRRKVSATGKISTENAPILAFYVAGTYTEAQLGDIARRIYDEAAREQFEGELETAEMADLDDVDVLGLANGDAISVRLGSNLLASIEGMSPGEAVTHLVSGASALDEAVARALVAAWQKAEGRVTTFYVKSALHSWSRDDGYRLKVSFIRYVGEAPGA